MKRSANRRELKRAGPLRKGLQAAGAAIAANPVMVGGATAFAIAFSYVSANALWYQPSSHKNAFFATRAVVSAQRPGEAVLLPPDPAPQTIVRFEPEPDVAGDPLVAQVQRSLMELRLYAGPVDGLTGPQTQSAVKDYQRILGLPQTGIIDERLLETMGSGGATRPADDAAMPAGLPVPASVPMPQPRAGTALAGVSGETVAATSAPLADPKVALVQAGLRAFGNDGIEIDGIVGERTRRAIIEFQALFGLPQTGEVDNALQAKMRDVGLTN